MNWTSAIGLFAALCTTASYFPQLEKCWETRSAGDLSLKMFVVLATGVALWRLRGPKTRHDYHRGQRSQLPLPFGHFIFQIAAGLNWRGRSQM